MRGPSTRGIQICVMEKRRQGTSSEAIPRALHVFSAQLRKMKAVLVLGGTPLHATVEGADSVQPLVASAVPAYPTALPLLLALTTRCVAFALSTV